VRILHLTILGIGLAVFSACSTTSGQAVGPGGGRGRGRGAAVQVQTATVERVSIERHADLSGTLVSPDQAKVSSEVAGIVRDVTVQLGSEVHAGDPLVRLEPRELALALERADSSLRQVEAQLGIARRTEENAPPDDQVASVRQAMANRDDAKNAYERASQPTGGGSCRRSTRTPPKRD
jgi:multidrug efflux pump subunit AcrA (membrane-fusion protein)